MKLFIFLDCLKLDLFFKKCPRVISIEKEYFKQILSSKKISHDLIFAFLTGGLSVLSHLSSVVEIFEDTQIQMTLISFLNSYLQYNFDFIQFVMDAFVAKSDGGDDNDNSNKLIKIFSDLLLKQVPKITNNLYCKPLVAILNKYPQLGGKELNFVILRNSNLVSDGQVIKYLNKTGSFQNLNASDAKIVYLAWLNTFKLTKTCQFIIEYKNEMGIHYYQKLKRKRVIIRIVNQILIF